MKKILALGALAFVVLCTLISAILPNPFLHGNFTAAKWQKMNDFYEFETTSSVLPTKQKSVMLDWNLAVDAMFQPFVETQVFDLKTQKTFVVQRTGGTYHADIEPSSLQDAQIFASVFANTSVSRLPVLVQLNGVWVAASLGTHIHGYAMIAENSFGGHLCLHFLNSKTDATKKVDPRHQKTIKIAQKLSQKNFLKFN